MALSSQRCHIVLVPGFGGFDALGRVEYYAGITRLFQNWQRRARTPVVLHYFDNLPTAAVNTRAAGLRTYLAKRIARGEILPRDKIVLVGHSTGGLDIRQLICDLHQRGNKGVHADGEVTVPARTIRDCLHAVVFLSVPHWGTNIADWVCSHPVLRKAFVSWLQASVAGSQVFLLDSVESQLAGGFAGFTGAELPLAAQDALTEANEHYGLPGPLRTAEAHEAASELGLYVRQMASDFHAINDLSSQPHHRKHSSPAHFDDDERTAELQLWDRSPDHRRIRVLSFATVAGRPFRFNSDSPAPVWELTNPLTYPEIARDLGLSAGTDFVYRLCYRACAGGPFQWPKNAGKVTRILPPAPPLPLEVWDNDGIVNTASMLWPRGDIVLVLADHLDVVGHFQLVKLMRANRTARRARAGYGPARVYRAYDALRSHPRFARKTFEKLWKEIFNFAVKP